MQLLVLILSKLEVLPSLLKRFLESSARGATVLDCQGIVKTMEQYDIEPPPIFGSLRQYFNPTGASNKLLLLILSDEQIPHFKSIIEEELGDIGSPNTGVLFTIPLTSVEGLANI